MDDDSLRNWGYYEPPLKGHLGLQLMSSVTERDTKPFRENPMMVSTNGSFRPRDCVKTEPLITHMDYVRDSWINHREKFSHMFPSNHYNNPLLGEASNTDHHSMQMMPQPATSKETRPSVEEEENHVVKKEPGPTKKRAGSSSAPKAPTGKKPRKGQENGTKSTIPRRAERAKKNLDMVINGIDMDISSMPTPVCSCTGTPEQCYKWGCGGWQSACCTTTISMHPLPMSTKRRGARIAGRKMSQGAFKKVLEKLASEGYDFSNPIDLRTYWAKHGTNKFVVIR